MVQACLHRVDEVDAAVQAWAFLDPEHALAQARAADELLGQQRDVFERAREQADVIERAGEPEPARAGGQAPRWL